MMKGALTHHSSHAKYAFTQLRSGCKLLSAQRFQRLNYSQPFCNASNGDRQMDPPDVRKLAKMAHISVTDEEVKDWEPQLQQIVSWFSQLQAVDVEGVPPAVRVDMEGENVLRPDTPVHYEAREAILSQVPETEGDFVKVPKIL